jgi:hypothetical protein
MLNPLSRFGVGNRAFTGCSWQREILKKEMNWRVFILLRYRKRCVYEVI